MKVIGKVLLIIASLLPQFLCASEKLTSLIFVEYGKDRQGRQLQNLMRYDFKDGVIVAKNMILSTDTFVLRYDLGENKIYQNRYLITHWGNIVDIHGKRILYQPKKGDGVQLCGLEQDRVILQRYYGERHTIEFYYYDLKKEKLEKLLQPGKWALPGLHSPDERQSITSQGNEILLHDLNGNTRSLGSGFNSPQSSISSFGPAPPMLWLDAQRILTQTDHGNLVILKTDGGIEQAMAIRPVIEATARPTGPCQDNGPYLLNVFGCEGRSDVVGNPSLIRDNEGNIIYEISSQSYILDLRRKNYASRDRIPADHGFDLIFTKNPCVVRYQEGEIGRCPIQYNPSTTSSGYLASTKSEMRGTQTRIVGINVWNKITMTWQFLPVDWLADLVGWIEE